MKNESQRDFDDRPSPEGIAGRAFAIERPAQSPPTALRDAAGNLARKVDHDPNGDGKQANCMRERDEEGIRSGEIHRSRAAADRLAERSARTKKCGC